MTKLVTPYRIWHKTSIYFMCLLSVSGVSLKSRNNRRHYFPSLIFHSHFHPCAVYEDVGRSVVSDGGRQPDSHKTSHTHNNNFLTLGGGTMMNTLTLWQGSFTCTHISDPDDSQSLADQPGDGGVVLLWIMGRPYYRRLSFCMGTPLCGGGVSGKDNYIVTYGDSYSSLSSAWLPMNQTS